jgi:hypothetical protein
MMSMQKKRHAELPSQVSSSCFSRRKNQSLSYMRLVNRALPVNLFFQGVKAMRSFLIGLAMPQAAAVAV